MRHPVHTTAQARSEAAARRMQVRHWRRLYLEPIATAVAEYLAGTRSLAELTQEYRASADRLAQDCARQAAARAMHRFMALPETRRLLRGARPAPPTDGPVCRVCMGLGRVLVPGVGRYPLEVVACPAFGCRARARYLDSLPPATLRTRPHGH